MIPEEIERYWRRRTELAIEEDDGTKPTPELWRSFFQWVDIAMRNMGMTPIPRQPCVFRDRIDAINAAITRGLIIPSKFLRRRDGPQWPYEP